MYWKHSPGLKQTTHGFASTPRYSFVVITSLSCQSKSSILGMMNERKSQKWNEETGSCRIFQRKCPVAETSHRRNVPSPKRPIAETSHRRNVPSPKRPIAETSHRRNVPSPKRPIAETSHRRNGPNRLNYVQIHRFFMRILFMRITSFKFANIRNS